MEAGDFRAGEARPDELRSRPDWQSLIELDQPAEEYEDFPEYIDDIAFAAHALEKNLHRENREYAEKHREETPRYLQERRDRDGRNTFRRAEDSVLEEADAMIGETEEISVENLKAQLNAEYPILSEAFGFNAHDHEILEKYETADNLKDKLLIVRSASLLDQALIFENGNDDQKAFFQKSLSATETDVHKAIVDYDDDYGPDDFDWSGQEWGLDFSAMRAALIGTPVGECIDRIASSKDKDFTRDWEILLAPGLSYHGETKYQSSKLTWKVDQDDPRSLGPEINNFIDNYELEKEFIRESSPELSEKELERAAVQEYSRHLKNYTQNSNERHLMLSQGIFLERLRDVDPSYVQEVNIENITENITGYYEPVHRNPRTELDLIKKAVTLKGIIDIDWLQPGLPDSVIEGAFEAYQNYQTEGHHYENELPWRVRNTAILNLLFPDNPEKHDLNRLREIQVELDPDFGDYQFYINDDLKNFIKIHKDQPEFGPAKIVQYAKKLNRRSYVLVPLLGYSETLKLRDFLPPNSDFKEELQTLRLAGANLNTAEEIKDFYGGEYYYSGPILQDMLEKYGLEHTRFAIQNRADFYLMDDIAEDPVAFRCFEDDFENVYNTSEQIRRIIRSDEYFSSDNDDDDDLAYHGNAHDDVYYDRIREYQKALDSGMSWDNLEEFISNSSDTYKLWQMTQARKNGFSMENYRKYPWLIPEYDKYNNLENINEFLKSPSDSARYNWCEKNSFVHLDGNWPRQKIGQVIYTRLNIGEEDSLHDASQFLESFQIPKEGFEVKTLKAGTNQENLDQYKIPLFSPEAEADFLARILGAGEDVRARINLPAKPQRIQQLFHSPASTFLYEEILQNYRNNLTGEDFVQKIEQELQDSRLMNNTSLNDFYDQNLTGSAKDSLWRANSFENFRSQVVQALQTVSKILPDVDPEKPAAGPAMQKLLQMGEKRKEYIDGATGFLVRHMTNSSKDLVKAWNVRPYALAAGVEDSVSEILSFYTVNGFWKLIEQNPEMVTDRNLTIEEIREQHQDTIKALAKEYGPEDILDGISIMENAAANLGDDEKLFTGEVRKLNHGESRFTGEILPALDVRGMLIGPETGCCMTIDGASETCIESGYGDRNAGFFALYEDNGRLMAQSYFYTNGDTVVMDNIEANQGRDANKIVDLYHDYFKGYLLDKFATDPNWEVRQVNIGTGYGEVAKPLVNRLPETDLVLNPNSDVYTDADEDQRLLLRLTDEEIARARFAYQERNRQSI